MERGQLDNTSPPRWAVTLDVLTADHGVPPKKRFVSWAKVAERTGLDPLVKGTLWRLSQPHSTELVLFGMHVDYEAAIYARLEQEGWPIAWCSGHPTASHFASTLKYRPEMQYVIDIPERLLMWGSRGITIAEVGRYR